MKERSRRSSRKRQNWIGDREPRYSKKFGTWIWKCANMDADPFAVYAHSKNLLPWPIYWGMPGAKGGGIAEHSSRAAAMDALKHGIEHPDP